MPSIERKKKSQKNKVIYIFITTFLITLTLFVYLAAIFTPEIDVDLVPDESDGNYSKHSIDDRLKAIQKDEFYGLNENDNNDETSAEIYERIRQMKLDAERGAQDLGNEDYEETTEAPPAKPTQTTKNIEENKNTALKFPTVVMPASTPVKMVKVYVGNYTSWDKAVSVQNELISLPLSISPFIKNMGNRYVLQVGSFTNPQKAKQQAEQLASMGYQTQVVTDN